MSTEKGRRPLTSSRLLLAGALVCTVLLTVGFLRTVQPLRGQASRQAQDVAPAVSVSIPSLDVGRTSPQPAPSATAAATAPLATPTAMASPPGGRPAAGSQGGAAPAAAPSPGPPARTPTLEPAGTPAPRYYVVQPRDTLWQLAIRFGVTVDDIVRANNLADRNHILAGQHLLIPEPGR